MHGVLPRHRVRSKFPPVQTVSEESAGGAEQKPTDQLVSDEPPDWFVAATRVLLPKDAGLALHYLTGFEERSCYRYASGERKPPAYFLRTILRSDHGWQWLCAVMAGANAGWWRDLQLAKRIGESALAEVRK